MVVLLLSSFAGLYCCFIAENKKNRPGLEVLGWLIFGLFLPIPAVFLVHLINKKSDFSEGE